MQKSKIKKCNFIRNLFADYRSDNVEFFVISLQIKLAKTIIKLCLSKRKNNNLHFYL